MNWIDVCRWSMIYVSDFVHLHELDNEGAVMQNVHQVYAGLTYGKGTLNESIQGVNYEKRGYQV